MTATSIKNVTLPNLAWETSADIYFPSDFNETKKYPAIVSTHPTGSCKEQTSGNLHGAALAREGFVVVAFDATFRGASGGKARFIEDPSIRVSDIRFIIDYRSHDASDSRTSRICLVEMPFGRVGYL